MIFFAVPPIIFFVSTVLDTLSFDRVLLGEERYKERMFDSYLYALVMLGVLSLLMVPSIILLNKTFSMYFSMISTLSEKDFQKLVKLNNKAIFYEKFMPSYIIKGDSVTVFRLLKKINIPFNDIKDVDVMTVYHKGYTAYVKIRTSNTRYHFTFYGNEFKIRYLLEEILMANPNVTVKRNWQN